jgi:hypothetical protein
MKLDNNYWNDRYIENDFGWDVGEVSSPLKNYFDQIEDKSIHILIPGAGNAHEAEYLFKNGFKNVFVLDFAKKPLEEFKTKNPLFNSNQLFCENFFEHKNQYDLIIEQTFFCAINPTLRTQYAKHMHSLLNENGKLVGLLFNENLNPGNPPFGGSKTEYLNYFEKLFTIEIFDSCYNSIKPRENKELFIKFVKK